MLKAKERRRLLFLVGLSSLQATAFSTSRHDRIAFVIPRPSTRKISPSDVLRITSSPLLVGRRSWLGSSRRNEDDEDVIDNTDEGLFGLLKGGSGEKGGKRKRDRIKDWVGGGTDKSKMVKPIRLDGSEDEDSDPPRVKAKFDSLFEGMPSMDEILNADSAETITPEESSLQEQKGRSLLGDDSWFDEEKQQIMDNYEVILQDMLANLEEQRREDDSTVPENAEAMIKSVLKQEMDTEIAKTKEKRAAEKLASYQKEQRLSVDKQDVSELLPTDSLKKLMEESEAEYTQREASRLEIENFLRYEQEAALRAAAQREDETIARPEKGEDLDQWVLERLEEMAGARQGDGEELILNNLEDSAQELKERMKKGEKKRSLQPESLKEWQMYRSIATRLDADSTESDKSLSEEEKKAKEDRILDQLESWKEYVEKEKGIRKSSGLSRGPKLPFEFQEFDLDKKAVAKGAVVDKKSLVETRKQLNRMSIQAMESILEKTADAARAENLRKEIEFLKSTLESNDYLDVDEEFIVGQCMENLSPVDTTDLFQSYSETAEVEEISREGRIPSSVAEEDTVSEPPKAPFLGTESKSPVTTPSRPYFEEKAESGRKVAPPNTAFFAETESDFEDEALSDDSKLGSIEEQKLEAMYRRAGARTTEERAKLKKQWEDFQEFEKGRREKSGLSSSDEETIQVTKKDLKYDISEVIKEDGDFDAEKILSSIGPRPSRKKRSSPDTAWEDAPPSSEKEEIGDDEKEPAVQSSVDKKEVFDSLYRSVAAKGGGRHKDDPEAEANEKASFREYLETEEKVRRSFQDTEEAPIADVDLPSSNATFNDVEYAQEVLSSLGPRPRPKRTRVIDEGAYSDEGGILASEDEDDEDLEESDEDDIGLMPEWLRKENEEAKGPQKRTTFLGGEEIDEAFQDTDYEHNMRQLADYERRRAGQKRQMGIDISDVLGSRDIRSDDYADYNFDQDYFRDRQNGWGSESFENRKANLLDYIELDVAELNSLMDHKESVYSTGVNPYTPRINKPFKAFGTIFRLEGVLVDITGLQLKAWTKVAEEYGFKPPASDEIRQATVTRPEIAARHILFWTDDFLECKNIAVCHRRAFREVFDDWMEEKGITPAEVPSVEPKQGSMSLGAELFEETRPKPSTPRPSSETERIELMTAAWTKTSEMYGKATPTPDEIVLSATLSPDIAITTIFKWTTDPLEVDKIVKLYRQSLAGEDQPRVPSEASEDPRPGSGPRPLTRNDVMELHYQVWNALAKDRGYDPPGPEEVLAAFTINDPEIAARDGFGWTDDADTLKEIVQEFREKLSELIGADERSKFAAAVRDGEKPSPEPEIAEKGPTPDEIFQATSDAWCAVAKKAKLREPDLEQVQFALTVGPEEAIATGFEWASEAKEIAALVDSYKEELARRRTWQSSEKDRPGEQRAASVSHEEPRRPSPDEVFSAALDAWTAVAKRGGFSTPDEEQVQFALSVGPEEAVRTGFEWTTDAEQVSSLVESYKSELGRKWQGRAPEISASAEDTKESFPDFQVMPGARKCVQSLLDNEMQCAVVSYLDRDQVEILLEQAGLDDLITPDKRVSASNGYVTDNDQLLGAALRVERRPDHCVVFDTTPYASAAAHDVKMQSVSFIGPFPRYDLLSADSTTSSFEEMTAMNIRRLFGERIYDQPQTENIQAQPGTDRKTKTKYFFDDER